MLSQIGGITGLGGKPMFNGTIRPGEDIYAGLERICEEQQGAIEGNGTRSFQVMFLGAGDELLGVATTRGRKIASLKIQASKIRFAYEGGRLAVSERTMILPDGESIGIKQGHFASEMQIAFY